MAQTPAQVVIDALRRHNVDTIFGLDGDHVIYLYDALSDAPDIKVITVMHENNASIAAEVYARASGKPGVVLVTAGPGATNSLSGIGGAFAAGVPIVHITGGVANDAPKESFHGVDDPDVLLKAFEPFTKESIRVKRAGDIPGALDRAFRVATQGRPGPVHVEITVSVLSGGLVDVAADLNPTVPLPRVDDPAALVERIRKAGSIAMVAGKNAFWPGVSDALVGLAEHLQAPVVHVWDAHGAMPTVHPLSLGFWREGNSNEFIDATFDAADLVLGVGVRQGTVSDHELTRWLGDRFVRIDATDDPEDDGHLGLPSVQMLESALQQIIGSVPERPADPAIQERCAEAKRLFAAGMLIEIEQYRNEPRWPIGLALESLGRKMTAETLVVSDVSNVKIWAPLQLPALNSLSHLQSGSWGAMGYVVPGVLGAALARPDRKVVGLVGDASFLMGSNDFGTICGLGLPVVIAVHADGQIGMIHYSLKNTFGRTYKTDIPPVDFQAYAAAFGCRHIRVNTPDEIDAAWDAALAANEPILLEFRAGHDYPRPYPIQRIINQGRSGTPIVP